MRTVLDEAATWWVQSLTYANELDVLVVEGIRAETSEDVRIGSTVVKDCISVEVMPASRRVRVRFRRVVAWQVVDESFTTGDALEVRDDAGFLAVLSSSAYLRFVEQHHGWFRDVVGPARHYRLWTEDDVIDVIAHDEPHLEMISPPPFDSA